MIAGNVKNHSTSIIFVHVDVEPTTLSNWEKSDAVEVREGERVGKPREKITSIVNTHNA